MNSSAALGPELAGPATCPSCHAADLTMTDSAVAAGANWRCGRCGQLWDAGRLAAVAAYGGWLSTRAASAGGGATSVQADV
jgi:predicted Zn finger-like uncharacterized protein